MITWPSYLSVYLSITVSMSATEGYNQGFKPQTVKVVPITLDNLEGSAVTTAFRAEHSLSSCICSYIFMTLAK